MTDPAVRLEELLREVSPLPWHVKRDVLEHRKGSPHCEGTCGRGKVPDRVYHDNGGYGRWEHVTEVHAVELDSVEDIVSANGSHVFCGGHDYDERGVIGLPDANYIVTACNAYPALVGQIAQLKAALEYAEGALMKRGARLSELAPVRAALVASLDPVSPGQGSETN